MKLFRIFVSAVALIFAGLVVGEAQITIPYSFSPGTTISSTQVNSDFSTLGTNALNRTGGTMTGALVTVGLSPSADNVSDIGSSTNRYANLWVKGTTQLNAITYTWPSSQTASYFLQTNGSGTLSWAAVTSPNWNPVYTAKTANYSAVANDYIDCTSGTFTVTLPAASGVTNKPIVVVNSGSGVITIARTGSDTIGNQAETSQTLNAGDSMTFFSDASSKWHIS